MAVLADRRHAGHRRSASLLLALFPATVAILGFGERRWQAVNPVTWYRVIRGLGPFYVVLLLALVACAGIARSSIV